jgi:hypothetical protein
MGDHMTFSFSGTINRFFNLLAQNAPLFLVLGLLGSVLPALAINYGLTIFMHVTTDSWAQNWNNFTPTEYAAIAAGLIGICALSLFNLAMITEVAIVRSVGKPVEISKVIGHALSNIIPVLIIGIMVSVVTCLGLILLIIPGIMFAYAAYVAIPARIAEPGAGLWGSVKRSFELTRNHRGTIFLLTLVVGLVMGILSGGMAMSTVYLQKGYVVPDIISQLTPVAFNSFSSILSNVFIAAIYVCLRESRDKMAPDITAALFD